MDASYNRLAEFLISPPEREKGAREL
jgi:hypothetical protein